MTGEKRKHSCVIPINLSRDVLSIYIHVYRTRLFLAIVKSLSLQIKSLYLIDKIHEKIVKEIQGRYGNINIMQEIQSLLLSHARN